MNSFDRRSEIIRHLREHERLSTRALSDAFQVSEVTIRSDLNSLEEQGWVQRVHGGAELAPRWRLEQSFADRQTEHLAEKQRLARAGAALVHPGDSLMLDGSTTAFQLALQLREMSDLRVVTNNLQVALALAVNPAIEVMVLGGIVRGNTASAVGSRVPEMLEDLHAGRGFFGASGLTAERGLTDADVREVEAKRAMVRAVDEVVALLDSSKFGQQAYLTFARLDQVHRIITDDGLPADYRAFCRERNIDLIIASLEP
jgi:DeoR/GlpR family transcriptional regulator of sugar metabolism